MFIAELTYLVQETLRFHPIVYHLTRTAGKDDVLPLSNPIVTATGETISEIPIAAGQIIHVSICAYNRYVLLARIRRNVAILWDVFFVF